MKATVLSIALSAAGSAVSAQQDTGLSSELQAKVEAAAQACAAFENGEFAMKAGAIVRTDLDAE